MGTARHGSGLWLSNRYQLHAGVDGAFALQAQIDLRRYVYDFSRPCAAERPFGPQLRVDMLSRFDGLHGSQRNRCR